MSLYEKTVYPRLTEPLTVDELAIHFTPSEEEIEFTIKTGVGEQRGIMLRTT